MKAIIIRHGKTQSNIERRYSGCGTDDRLTEESRKSLAELPVSAENPRLYVSPMIRARETAAILFPDMDQRVIWELREMDFGKFEGKNHEELDGDPDYQEWIDSYGTTRIPGGESRQEFRERTMEAFREIVREAHAEGVSDVLIVAHGGTLMAVMSELTGGEYFDFLAHNGEGYEIDLEVDDAGNIVAAGPYNGFCGGVHSGRSDW